MKLRAVAQFCRRLCSELHGGGREPSASNARTLLAVALAPSHGLPGMFESGSVWQNGALPLGAPKRAVPPAGCWVISTPFPWEFVTQPVNQSAFAPFASDACTRLPKALM